MSNVYIFESQVYFNNEERNTQPIKEALMREAVKQCECYCTDLLHFFNYKWHELIQGGVAEIVLYFRQMGVEWEEIHDYRSKAVLKRDTEKDTLELTIECGNC